MTPFAVHDLSTASPAAWPYTDVSTDAGHDTFDARKGVGGFTSMPRKEVRHVTPDELRAITSIAFIGTNERRNAAWPRPDMRPRDFEGQNHGHSLTDSAPVLVYRPARAFNPSPARRPACSSLHPAERGCLDHTKPRRHGRIQRERAGDFLTHSPFRRH